MEPDEKAGSITLPPAPRTVSRTTKLWFCLKDSVIVLTWPPLFLATVLFWKFLIYATPFSPEPRPFRSPHRVVTDATIAAIDTAGIDNDGDLYFAAYQFNYTISGKAYTGVTHGHSDSLKIGDSVRIEYSINRPHRARIVELENVAGLVVLFFLGMTAFGLLILFLQWRTQKTEVAILQYGQIGMADRNKLTETAGEDEDRYWLSTYHFVPYPGYVISITAKDREKYHYRHEEPVIYLPDDPEKNRLIKALDAPLEFDAHGNHVVDKRISLALVCILPATLIVQNLYFLITTFF